MKHPEKKGWYWGWVTDEWLPMYYNPEGGWYYEGIGVPEPDKWVELPTPERIEDASPVWCVADCECKACYKTWVGVLHTDRRDRLECPRCGEMTGIALYIHDLNGDEK